MMQDKDLTDDVLDEIIAGAKTSMEQYLALSLKAERTANRQQSSQQNNLENIPFEQWLSQQTGTIDVECGCVMTEAFFHWLRVAYETGNSPAIPDGWVACSERMPEDEQEVLTRNRMGHCFVSFFDEHSGLFFDRVDVAAACCIEHILVTHWMPLPAAPQQEA